ncbi:MAG: 4'-phosphopantetheinyl transferase superfamily protein [Lysobacterales bacterium]
MLLIGLRSLMQLPLTPADADKDDRARAIGNPLRRRQYLAGRALLRELLGHWPGVDPTTEIRARPGQAPTLPAWPSLRLSVSHSGPLVAAAVADQPVGIDVEEPRVGRDLSSLARWSMDEVEYAAWDALPPTDRTAAFYRSWTAKEAAYKASAQTQAGLAWLAIEAATDNAAELASWALPPDGACWLSVCSPALERLHIVVAEPELPENACFYRLRGG